MTLFERPTGRIACRMRRRWWIVAALVVTTIGTHLAVFYFGAYGVYRARHRYYIDTVAQLQSWMLQPWTNLTHAVRGLFARAPTMNIHIGFLDYQTLRQQRAAAVEQGVLVARDDTWVPCTIAVGERDLPAKIRLKGDWVDHLRTDAWSFRVKLANGTALEGVTTFSLQHPRTRNFIYEWLWQTMIRREGGIGLRYRLYDVAVNGKPLGVYAFEEHFSKQLLESQQRRDGPILKFAEDLLWEDRAHFAPMALPPALSPYQSMMASAIEVFQPKRWSPAELRGLREAASGLLARFRDGRLPAHEVFDVPAMARMAALSHLMGATHALIWHNLRFYYNPVTTRLEPIAFDGNAGSLLREDLLVDLYDLQEQSFNRLLMRDAVFVRAYLAAIERVVQPGFLERFIADVGPTVDSMLPLMYRSDARFRFSWQTIRHNRSILARAIDPPGALRAYAGEALGDPMTSLHVSSAFPFPVDIVGFEAEHHRWELPQPVTVAGRIPGRAPVLVPLSVASRHLPPTATEWRVMYRIAGTGTLRTAVIQRYDPDPLDLAVGEMRAEATVLTTAPFLEVREATKEVQIRSGRWTVTRSVIVPPGYTLTARGPVQLDLRQGAVLLSRSPVLWLGDVDAPIEIFSGDDSGTGVVVTQTTAPSRLHHVHFHHLAAPQRPRWALTGGVTFYEAEVAMHRVTFADMRAEDALNVVRSSFVLDEVRFARTRGDAVDADFSDGTIRGAVFSEIGNDAVDLSGSRVQLLRLSVDGTGDKGVSIGEQSEVWGEALTIAGAPWAVVSKDLSKVTLRHVAIRGAVVPLAAYQKKPEYGPAFLTVADLSGERPSAHAKVWRGSSIVVDGAALPVTETRRIRRNDE